MTQGIENEQRKKHFFAPGQKRAKANQKTYRKQFIQKCRSSVRESFL